MTLMKIDDFLKEYDFCYLMQGYEEVNEFARQLGLDYKARIKCKRAIEYLKLAMA